MGRTARRKPRRLGAKLLRIRQALDVSQNGLIRLLSVDELVQGTISAYESGSREPSLLVLLAYSRLANVSVESLIDDELDLPAKLPARVKGEGIKRPAAKHGSGRARQRTRTR
jgi:transcriptional regulator with XRE-family HTH domain